MDLSLSDGRVQDLLADRPAAAGVLLTWLGQAGFALRCGELRLLIDPYLSNSLGEKYRGTEFPHVRLMPSPIEPWEVRPLDWVLCTHGHSDHLDPGTLPHLAQVNPECRFLVPRAEREKALSRGVPAERMVTVNAGESCDLSADVRLTAIPSAHELLQANSLGEHLFLGYVLRSGGIAIYHPGDCVPYAGLAESLRREHIDVALLPVNGRDTYRASRGVPGNMDFAEAVQLCLAAGIPWLVPHHFGLFDFNTVELPTLEAGLAQLPSGLRGVLPRVGLMMRIANP